VIIILVNVPFVHFFVTLQRGFLYFWLVRGLSIKSYFLLTREIKNADQKFVFILK
jgi:hypothetical protein